MGEPGIFRSRGTVVEVEEDEDKDVAEDEGEEGDAASNTG